MTTNRSFLYTLIAILFLTMPTACGGNDPDDPGEGEAEGEEGEAESEAEGEGENWEVACGGSDAGNRPADLPDPSGTWRIGSAQIQAAGQLATDGFDPRGCGFRMTCVRKGDDNQQCQDFSATCEAFRWRWEDNRLLIQTESAACQAQASVAYEVTPGFFETGKFFIQLADPEGTRRIMVSTDKMLAACADWVPSGKTRVGECWDCDESGDCGDILECTDDRWIALECRCVNTPNDNACAKRGPVGSGWEAYCGAPKDDCVCPHCHCYAGGCTEESCLDSCVAEAGCAYGDICHW
ncbi:hypothetical protein HY477_00710 [Candidatus Uhrbacteria bacterium]|nr:hypothetical protein [Candidatus Uhrbacteria bacterium]